MTAQERLREWQRRNLLTQREAASILGMHYTHFNQILNGRRKPGVRNAIRIQRETGIAVDCWLPTDEPRNSPTAPDAVEIAK